MKLWDELLPLLRQMLGEEEYLTWIEPLRPSRLDGSILTLECQNKIVGNWVRDHLLRDIESVARSRFGPDFTIVLIEPQVREQTPSRKAAIPPSVPDARHAATRAALNPAFTFERFVIGPSNQFACAAAEAVADRPGHTYNPLFIYGDSGLGKTHLLHAIAHRLLNVNGTPPKVVYLTTEQFVNDLINRIRRKEMDTFRETFRAVDVLLLDDIQFIAGKERTQEEFFHTFNTLQGARRQVVFTSDSRPADIPGLEERLRSRFLQGLLADIQPPDLETRCAILREKARAIGWDLPEDVVMFIARRVQKNVRELEGCLNRTIAFAQLTNRPISVELVRSALAELLPQERANTPGDIIRFVAHHYGVRVSDLKGRSNRRSIALPRQVAMFLIREILGLSYPEIGKIFSKHHSTVIYAVDNINKTRQSNPDFDATLTSFQEHFSE
ncbi:MAG: chromosomal replication initiator protein DnaA [Acidobacteria bacterium]|nr:chromosomal replication initiator protein DnaA [Acidobacteriota bacterium]